MAASRHEARLRVRVSQAIRHEYDTRDVFGQLPDGRVVEVDRSTAKDMLDEAEFNADARKGPELMPVGTRLAYAALGRALSEALAHDPDGA